MAFRPVRAARRPASRRDRHLARVQRPDRARQLRDLLGGEIQLQAGPGGRPCDLEHVGKDKTVLSEQPLEPRLADAQRRCSQPVLRRLTEAIGIGRSDMDDMDGGGHEPSPIKFKICCRFEAA